jgi:heptosyltransferase-1
LNVLIVKLSSLGDVVHAMAAVQDLMRSLPHAQVDWVVERAFAPLVARCQGVRRVIPCELRAWRKDPWSRTTRTAWRGFRQELRQQPYDAVIDLQGLSKSALVAWMARLAPGGRRIGLANQTEGSGFEAPARWVAHQAIALPEHIHAVTRSRELCARALHYPLPVPLRFGLLAHAQHAAPDLALQALRSGRLGVVALVHGSSRTDKSWPLEHWRELVQRLDVAGFAVALPQSNAAEEAAAQAIAQGFAQAQVWPRMALDAVVDALATCCAVVGVDSGLSHIAVALDLPHVQIYNFDTAWRTGPLADPVQHGASHAAPAGALAQPRQQSVYGQAQPSVDAVWAALQRVRGQVGEAEAA